MRRSARHNRSRLHKQEREARAVAVQAGPRLPQPELVQPRQQKGYTSGLHNYRASWKFLPRSRLAAPTPASQLTMWSHERRKENDACIVGGTPRGGFAHPGQRRGADERVQPVQPYVQLYAGEQRGNLPCPRGPDSLLARPPAFREDVHAPALRPAISGTQPGANGRWSLQQVRGAAIDRSRTPLLGGGSEPGEAVLPFARASLARTHPESFARCAFSFPEPTPQPAHSAELLRPKRAPRVSIAAPSVCASLRTVHSEHSPSEWRT